MELLQSLQRNTHGKGFLFMADSNEVEKRRERKRKRNGRQLAWGKEFADLGVYKVRMKQTWGGEKCLSFGLCDDELR